MDAHYAARLAPRQSVTRGLVAGARGRAPRASLPVAEGEPERRHVVRPESTAPASDTRRDADRRDVDPRAGTELVAAGDLGIAGAERQEREWPVFGRDADVRPRADLHPRADVLANVGAESQLVARAPRATDGELAREGEAPHSGLQLLRSIGIRFHVELRFAGGPVELDASRSIDEAHGVPGEGVVQVPHGRAEPQRSGAPCGTDVD